MKLNVLSLKPTQMAVGYKEVDYRLHRIKKMGGKELEDYLHERRAPVVLGPEGATYIVDHHHLVRSCWEAGVEDVPVERLADLSHLKLPEFWIALKDAHWIYPFDQFGQGPHDPIHLPPSIRSLADDPFRGLAWMAREAGLYTKSEKPFAEFQWANFFRKKLKKHPYLQGYDECLKEAKGLALGAEAQHLPGFAGN